MSAKAQARDDLIKEMLSKIPVMTQIDLAEKRRMIEQGAHQSRKKEPDELKSEEEHQAFILQMRNQVLERAEQV